MAGEAVAGAAVGAAAAAVSAAEGSAVVAGDEPRRECCSAAEDSAVNDEGRRWRMKMTHVKIMILRGCVGLALLALIMSVASCNKSEKPAATEVAQKTFASPDDAAKALVEAAKAGNRDALVAIFGPGSQDIIFSGDTAQDKTSFENFTAAYTTMNRWRKQTDGSEVLVVGADNNPFPIPLKKNSAGQWYFDTAAGKDEILSRRIGGNELAAMDVVSAMDGCPSRILLAKARRRQAIRAEVHQRRRETERAVLEVAGGAAQESTRTTGSLCCCHGRIHPRGRQAAAVSRVFLPHPHQTRCRSSRRREGLCRQRKDEWGLRLRRLPGKVR